MEEEKVTDRLQAYAEALAGHAGSKAFMTTATEMEHIRSVWLDYAEGIVHTENRLLRQDHVVKAMAGRIQEGLLDSLGLDLPNDAAEAMARSVIAAAIDEIDPRSRALTNLVRMSEEDGLYEDRHSYDERLRQPMSEEAVKALRERLESGNFPRRTVKRRDT
jgi:hypothetical protein